MWRCFSISSCLQSPSLWWNYCNGCVFEAENGIHRVKWNTKYYSMLRWLKICIRNENKQKITKSYQLLEAPGNCGNCGSNPLKKELSALVFFWFNMLKSRDREFEPSLQISCLVEKFSKADIHSYKYILFKSIENSCILSEHLYNMFYIHIKISKKNICVYPETRRGGILSDVMWCISNMQLWLHQLFNFLCQVGVPNCRDRISKCKLSSFYPYCT